MTDEIKERAADEHKVPEELQSVERKLWEAYQANPQLQIATLQNIIATLRTELATARRQLAEREAECERLTRELEEMRDENGQLQGQLLCDNEKRLIRKLIEEHGVVDETLWSALVRERDTLQEKLDRLREWMMQERDSWAGKNADRHWQMNRVVGQFDELAALLSDAAEMRKPETNYDPYVDDPMLGPM